VDGRRGYNHEAVDQPEDARKPKIGDDDHHPEEKGDRLHIDRAICLIEREDPEPDHQARGQQRGAGAIDALARPLADGHDDIGSGKNGDRSDDARLRHIKPRSMRPGSGVRRRHAVAVSQDLNLFERDQADHIIRPGDCSSAGLREKARFVLGEMEGRLIALGFQWRQTTDARLHCS
jgi:hypothetical protein